MISAARAEVIFVRKQIYYSGAINTVNALQTL